MKIRLLGVLVGFVVGFASPTFAQQKDTVDPKVDQQIRALAAKFDAAINKHDAAAVAALYTEEGVHTRGGASHGRQAIEKSYAKDFQRWRFSNHFTRVDRLIAASNEVRGTGKWSQTFQDENGVRGNDEGYYSWILVREGDTWKIRKDTVSFYNPWGTN
jgi:uncharacterized protein (TIGR02246 family)